MSNSQASSIQLQTSPVVKTECEVVAGVGFDWVKMYVYAGGEGSLADVLDVRERLSQASATSSGSPAALSSIDYLLGCSNTTGEPYDRGLSDLLCTGNVSAFAAHSLLQYRGRCVKSCATRECVWHTALA